MYLGMQTNYWGRYVPHLPRLAPLGFRASIPQKGSSSIQDRIKDQGALS